MAHFAKLDENNVVVQVIVVSDKDTCDADGVEKEHIGAAFCEKLLGGKWKQTSYNNRIRKHYAGVGYTYREDIDAFVPPQPYPSWTLDADANWQPPIPKPVDDITKGFHYWDEENKVWIEKLVFPQG